MFVLNGRYGPYIKAGDANVKIPKGEEPASLTLARCKELANGTAEKDKAERATKDAANAIKAFPENPDILILNGKYGAYIKAGDKNVKIPVGEDPALLTLARCLELAKDTPDKKTTTATKKATTTTKKAATTTKKTTTAWKKKS